MADDIRDRYGIRAELVRGSGGVFEVSVDDELIFSKEKTGRFPEPGEIVEMLGVRAGA